MQEEGPRLIAQLASRHGRPPRAASGGGGAEGLAGPSGSQNGYDERSWVTVAPTLSQVKLKHAAGAEATSREHTRKGTRKITKAKSFGENMGPPVHRKPYAQGVASIGASGPLQNLTWGSVETSLLPRRNLLAASRNLPAATSTCPSNNRAFMRRSLMLGRAAALLGSHKQRARECGRDATRKPNHLELEQSANVTLL